MIDTFAFEVSSSRKKYLKENNLRTLNLNDIQNYSGFFDYIRFDQVLEHLDDVNDVLSVLKKISNTKCILFVSVLMGLKLLILRK